MSWIAAAIGGATALVGASSANKAANAQKDASQAQIDLATRMYNDNVGRADQNLAAQQSIFNQTLANQTGQTQQTLEDQLRVAGMTREEQLRLAGGYQEDALRSSRMAMDASLGYFDPYAQSGLSANNALMIEYGLAPGESQFQTTPGYEFKMNEALGGVEGSAAASGSLMSGATMESLLYTGHGIADQEYDDYLMGLTDMTNRGYSAATNMASTQMQADATRQNIYGNYAGMASNAYGNYGNQAYNAYGTQGANNYNAYGMYGSGMASANQNTFNALAGAGSEYQANMNTALANQGNATAAGYMAPSNALMAGIESGVNMYGYMNTPNPWMQSNASTVPASSQQAAASGWGVY
jgi:gas vesicle protein